MSRIDITTMTDTQISILRKQCLRSLYIFCRTVMGYDDLDSELHGDYCFFLEGPETRKDAELPRGYIKTWIGTIAYSIWVALPRSSADEFPDGVIPTNSIYNLGSNIRILIASYVIGNAMKMIGLIRKTYERNQAMMILFPEVIPDNFNKTKWSDSEATIQRSEDFTESTFEAGGIGGSTTSRHYDLIIEDDLIYACKDDLIGTELQPNQEDIDKAIGWHKLANSLLVPGSHTCIHNIGTRWAKHDLKEYIRKNETSYVTFTRSATVDGDLDLDSIPTWPGMYPINKLRQIRDAQGPYMFATQYLGKPISPEEMLFKREWLQYYKTTEELPKLMRIFTTSDLSLWSQPKRKNRASRGVVLTCGWDSKNHVWILRYDIGRFDPSEIIDKLYLHNKLFQPEMIGVEAVYYQKSLLHFLRKEMEGLRGWLPVRELETDSSVSKELRIRALEPYAMNEAIHCKLDHMDFITEFSEYVPNNQTCTKDILDALAYQIQVARPGLVESQPINRLAQYEFKVKIDDVLDNAWSKHKRKSAFKEYELTKEELESSELFNPFLVEQEP